MSGLQVISPLYDLIGNVSEEQRNIAEFAFNHHKHNLVQFYTTTMNLPQPQQKQKQKSARNEFTVRQLMQEMRSVGLDSLSCDYILKNGQRVGEFLLSQWLEKETKKKKK